MPKYEAKKRPNGSSYDIWRDHTGKRHWVYGKNSEEVGKKLTRARNADEQHRAVAPARLTVGQFLTNWLRTTAKLRVREGSFRDYESIARVHLIPTLGKKRILDLTAADVKEVLAEKLAGGLSPRRVQMIYGTLRCACNDGVEDKILDFNPILIRRAVRVEKPPKRQIAVEEVRAILHACEGTRLYPLMYTAVSTSLRQGELLGLQWSDLDLNAGTMTVLYQLQKGKRVILKNPSDRPVGLSSGLVKVLRAHRLSQDPISPFVFTSERGTPLDGTNVTHRLESVERSHGLPATDFKFLRHAAASLFHHAGAGAPAIQALMGHSDPKMSMHYAKAVPEGQREFAERVSEMLAG